MKIEYSPLNHLAKLLLQLNIPFEDPNRKSMGQILYPNNANRRCSIIFGPGSLGYEDGLLEIQGLTTEEEARRDDVVGNLTVVDVLNRIAEDWSEYRNVYYESESH
jgi:hypothetical protein